MNGLQADRETNPAHFVVLKEPIRKLVDSDGLDSFLLAIHPLVSSEDEAIAREDDDDDDDFLPTVRF